jgi:hypothetical protein
MKTMKLVIATTVMSVVMATTALAGTWSAGEGVHQDDWWYDNGDGTYASNGWHWIDGDNDGIAERYYFDADGWLLVNTTTPDGAHVNENGAMTENGVVQTQSVETASASVKPLSTDDFIVSGNNSVTANNADNSVISNWKRVGYPDDHYVFHTFVSGDSIVTARGISFASTKNDIISKYGEAAIKKNNPTNDDFCMMVKQIAAGTNDEKAVFSASTVIEYTSDPYGLRFFFDENDALTVIMYTRTPVKKK